MSNIMAWISAFRLRTLPLALSSIGMGSFLAAYYGGFKTDVFILSVIVTILLQSLSNLANDYGDSRHGADSHVRKGPKRAVQSGAISPRSMKRAIFLFAGLSLVSGIALLYVSFGFSMQFFFFLGLGLLAIAAAVAYTNGKKPYGYAGLGDIAVMIFFGFVGALGSLYLHIETIYPLDIFPALSSGFLATAVLNVNNIRDMESDRKAGKRSIPVRLGRRRAAWYHWFLLAAALATALVYAFETFESWRQYIFLVVIPLLIKNGLAVGNKTEPAQLDPFLKQLAMTTLLFVATFGVGLTLM